MASGTASNAGFVYNGAPGMWEWWQPYGNGIYFSDRNFPETLGAGNHFQVKYTIPVGAGGIPTTEDVSRLDLSFTNGDIAAGMDFVLSTPLRTLDSFSLGGCGQNQYGGANFCDRTRTWVAAGPQQRLRRSELSDIRFYVYSRGGRSFSSHPVITWTGSPARRTHQFTSGG